MKTSIKTKIEDLLASGYNVGFGELLNKTIETYKGIWLIGGLAMVCISISSSIIKQVFSLIFGVSSAAFLDSELMGDPEAMNQAILDMYTQPLFIGYIVISVLIGLLFYPAYAGIIKMAKDFDQGKSVDFASIFKYYKAPYFGKIILGAFLFSLLVGLGFMACAIPGIYLMVAFMIYLPLIIFHDLDSWSALKYSLTIITKNWFVFFFVGLVTWLLVMLGLLACIIGIFFTYPLIFSFIYNAYKTTIGVDAVDNEIGEIGTQNSNYSS